MDRKRRKTSTVCLTRRRSFNAMSFIFTICVLLVAAQLASSNFTARINKISDDLHKALGIALDLDGPNFTDLYENVSYRSVDSFNPRGMSGLYNITTKFIDVLVNKKAYPDGFLEVVDGQLQLGSFQEQWQSLLKHYAALIAISIILLLFGVLMPICGLCFCCCRCCGKCGARSKPFDKKGDLCRKMCLASFLIIFGTLLLFGVVCAFVSNQHMQDGTNELTDNLKIAITDADEFIDATDNQIKILFGVNYGEFESLLFSTLDNCSDIVLDQLGEYSNATALTEVVNIVNGLDGIKSNLTYIKGVSNELQVQAYDLKNGLNSVKYELLNALTECESLDPCNDLLKNYINELHVEIDYSNLPDISNELGLLSSVLDSGIQATVEEGLKAFEGISDQINDTIIREIPKVKSAVEQAGRQISAGSSNVTMTLEKVKAVLHEYVDEPLVVMDGYLQKYSPYRYYTGLGVSCVLLLITLCITLGLICGVCGKRPDAYSDDCCNKGAGSRFLMIGVGIMFMFAIVFVIVTVAHFFVGILSQRLVCDSLREHEDNQVVKLIDEVMNLKQNIGLDVNISWILSSCNQNFSAYNVFQLQSQFDLNQVANYIDKFEINKTLNELISQINASTNVEILSDEAKQDLKDLVKSGIANINYDKFIDELATNLTSADLSLLATKLHELVAVVEEKLPNNPSLPRKLTKCANHLKRLQVDFITPMTDKAKKSIEVALTLQKSLTFGKDSFEVAINDLINELEAAQSYLQINGSNTMTEIATKFGYGMEGQVQTYLHRVVNNTRDKVGSCGPLSAGLNSTLIATCDKILLPWNGFWFSLMWCLILFIPTIILSVKLASLYQKYEPYPGPLVEAEYLYDAYADRDNIPLNSSVSDKRSKMKNKKKHKRYERGSYGADAGNEQGIPREMPSGSHYQDARYADMAPKHWDEFPAGGPPQYQRAPTEYERPPPYYYPGTEQQ